jgi:hypothetical protein
MSVQRSYAQRNGNLTQLIPRIYPETLTFDNISDCAVYTLNISKAHFVGGNYYVDLCGVDFSGNALNFDGRFGTIIESEASIPIIVFAIDVDTVPSVYTGLDFTIFFKNLPTLDTLDIPIPLLTIGIISASSLVEETIPLPYIVSPPFPPVAGINISPNITLKSDGDNFDVVASGPAGWFGVPALAAILQAYNIVP